MLDIPPKKAHQKLVREVRKEGFDTRPVAHGQKGRCIFRSIFTADGVLVTVEWWMDGQVKAYTKDYGLHRRTCSTSMMLVHAVQLTKRLVDAYK
jgi:hypothetical protein